MAANIGRVGLRVFFRDRSPFSPQPRQEAMHYFDEDIFRGFKTSQIAAVPGPINGYRLIEDLQNYDNFIEDEDGSPLESSFVETAAASEDSATASELAAGGGAAGAGNEAAAGLNQMAAARFAEVSKKNIDKKEKDFFTWQIGDNLFVRDEKNNPAADKFNEAPLGSSNKPHWTYGVFVRPSGNKKATILITQQVRTTAENKDDLIRTIHWGIKTKTALAAQQPFEINFVAGSRSPNPWDTNKNFAPVTPRFNFFDQGGQPMDLELVRSVYAAVEVGIGSARHRYLFLFKLGSNPMLFRMASQNGGATVATLISRFEGARLDRIHDIDYALLTIAIEPVLGHFVVRTNIFDKPWIILSSPDNPFILGKGPIVAYGGNLGMGVFFRPIQYDPIGTIETPPTTYTIYKGNKEPTCTTSLKGAGSVEQDRTYSEDEDAAEVHAVDAERVNGKSVRTPISAEAAEALSQSGTVRNIRINTLAVDDKNNNPAAQPGTGSSFTASEKTFRDVIELEAGDAIQGNGYVVIYGRSPYIWRLRCEILQAPGAFPVDLQDISCDVMSIDLTWNAVSYNEFKYSGSIKVLNRKQATLDNPRAPIDYRSFTNRAIYLRIEAFWEIGAGHDPGPGNRNLFEGLTLGATVETVAEREIVTFQIEDYMAALHGGKFVLSPAYDGMTASLAARDIVQQLGLSDNRIFRNGTNLKNANLGNDLGLAFGGILEKPLFRFRDGTSYKDALLRIAKLDWKTIYFDRFGNFHWDDVPGDGILGGNGNTKSVADFWSSPKKARAAGDNPDREGAARLVWNNVSFSRAIGDVYNAISVVGVEKRLLAKIASGSAYKAGIFNPNAVGYLGFRKQLIIEDGALGSIDAVFRYLDNYRRRVFIPPLTAKFETYGYTGLKPLDVIRLDGQKLRIMNIQMHLDASQNQYWMNVEGEWFFAAGKGEDPGLFESSVDSTGTPDVGQSAAQSSVK